ncbi:polyphenol oxidase family protein, partial [Desulfovibrio sp. OttesenSCG-928-I05]|nr:polyphenol oxidase family protein [Desulfovibrio sp. OttesenSCG-928-I05]
MDQKTMIHNAIPFTFPGAPHIHCLFGTRAGGSISPVQGVATIPQALTSRAALLEAAHVTVWAELRQIHGDHIVRNPAPTPLNPDFDAASPLLPEADGQFTDQTAFALAIKTADCQPLFLAHPSGPVAALHVGWRGNRIGFPQTAVRAFCEHYSLIPAEVLAVRGPSLGPAAAEFINFGTEWSPEFTPWFNPHTKTMDLWSLTRAQLQQAGVLPHNIFGIDCCTKTMHNHFFSYRLRDAGR